MSPRSTFLDPLALVVGFVVTVGAFFLIPGVTAALLAALGIGVLAYAATLGVRALPRRGARSARPAVGAGSDSAAVARVRRGSAIEAWQQRGHRTVASMQQLVANCESPIIAGQLENVLFEAKLSLPVLDDLAQQAALVQASLLRGTGSDLNADHAQLEKTLADADATLAITADRQDAIDAVADQQDTRSRLQQTEAGLIARMEALVRGLEGVSAHMGETAASSAATVTGSPIGSDEHLQSLSDQLAGLQAGISESRQYSAQITPTQPE
ncbi:hypothetical protein [Cumulibacter soli]|uniref:hypothetical protein n=1 Tax=Cumulibacter soli TaxID=2546344 RepID=UPI0010672CD2|nr:hypothetical protein [Cumulibacter soli]